MILRAARRFFSTRFAVWPYGLMARMSNHFLAPALYRPGRNSLSGTPTLLSGMPAVTMSAPGSAALIGPAAALSSLAYCFGLGPRGQYAFRLGSFQICHAPIGILGTLGFSDQNVPLGP